MKLCQVKPETLSKWVDLQQADRNHVFFSSHVATCEQCQERLRSWKRLGSLLQQTTDLTLTRELGEMDPVAAMPHIYKRVRKSFWNSVTEKWDTLWYGHRVFFLTVSVSMLLGVVSTPFLVRMLNTSQTVTTTDTTIVHATNVKIEFSKLEVKIVAASRENTKVDPGLGFLASHPGLGYTSFRQVFNESLAIDEHVPINLWSRTVAVNQNELGMTISAQPQVNNVLITVQTHGSVDAFKHVFQVPYARETIVLGPRVANTTWIFVVKT